MALAASAYGSRANSALKTYLVTGGSAGIGFGVVAHMLQHNASKIYFLSMKEEHAQQAKESLKDWGDASHVEWVQCNLEDLKKTDEVAKKLKGELKTLDGVSAPYLETH